MLVVALHEDSTKKKKLFPDLQLDDFQPRSHTLLSAGHRGHCMQRVDDRARHHWRPFSITESERVLRKIENWTGLGRAKRCMCYVTVTPERKTSAQ